MSSAVLTHSGYAALTAKLASGSTSTLNEIAVGTGIHVAAATDTTLSTQIARIGTNPASTSTTTFTNDTLTVTQTYVTSTGGESITESGLFFSAGGPMYASATYTGTDILTLPEAGSSAVITYSVKISG